MDETTRVCDVPSTEIAKESLRSEDKEMGSTKAKSPSLILGIGHSMSFPAIKVNCAVRGAANVGGSGWTTLMSLGYVVCAFRCSGLRKISIDSSVSPIKEARSADPSYEIVMS